MGYAQTVLLFYHLSLQCTASNNVIYNDKHSASSMKYVMSKGCENSINRLNIFLGFPAILTVYWTVVKSFTAAGKFGVVIIAVKQFNFKSKDNFNRRSLIDGIN